MKKTMLAAAAAIGLAGLLRAEPNLETTGTAVVEDGKLILDACITNITAEADLGDVSQVVFRNGGGIALAEAHVTNTLAKTYAFDGDGLAATGVVSITGNSWINTGLLPNIASASVGHTFVKKGAGTLAISKGPGVVNSRTRWIVEEGTVRQEGGDFFGNHSSTTTNCVIDVREGATYWTGSSHCPIGPLELTGGTANFTGGSSMAGEWAASALRGGVVAHECATPSVIKISQSLHLNHVYTDVPFVIEPGAVLEVYGTLRNGWPSSYFAGCAPVPNKLVASGGGELRLYGDNHFTGGVKISGGTKVVAGSMTAFGQIGKLEVEGEATLEVPAGFTFVCESVTGSGTLTKTGAGGLAFGTVAEGVTVVRAPGEGAAGNAFANGVIAVNGVLAQIDVPAGETFVATGFDVQAPASLANKTDIVKTGDGTLVLPEGDNRNFFRGLTINGGVVRAKNEMALGNGSVTIKNGGFLEEQTDATLWHKIIVQGEGGVIVPEGVNLGISTNMIEITNAKFVKRGAGRFSFKGISLLRDKCANAHIVAEEGLTTFDQDAFGAHSMRPDKTLEVRSGACVRVNAHLPLGRVIMRGGRLETLTAPLRYRDEGSKVAIENPFTEWQHGISVNGTIEALPSADGSPSVIEVSRIYLGHVACESAFDVAEGAVLKVVGGRVDDGRDAAGTAPLSKGFVKRGAGEMVFDSEANFSGCAEVREGVFTLGRNGRFDASSRLRAEPGATVRLADGAVLAAGVETSDPFIGVARGWIDSTAEVHFDASRVVALPGEQVASVRNYGTAGGSFGKFTAGTIPTAPVYTNNAINGKPALYFNGGSALTTAAYTNKTATMTMFMVAQWTSWDYNNNSGGKGHWGGGLSMSSFASTKNDNETYYSFHTESANSINNTYFSGSQVGTIQTVNPARGVGDAYVDEAVYNGTSLSVRQYTGPDDTEVNMSATQTSGSKFDIDRLAIGGRLMGGGKCQYGGSTTASGNRMYIGHIGEVIVFTRVLTDDEKKVVRAYLKRKWFDDGEAQGLIEEFATVGGDVVIDVPEGSAAVAGDLNLAGDGELDAIRKTGAGALNLRANVSGAGALRVEDGTMELSDRAVTTRADVWLDASDASTIGLEGGKAVTVRNKGRCGGTFVRAPGRYDTAVPAPAYEEAGMNGRNVLRFNWDAGLSLNSYTNVSPKRKLHVYMAMQRMDYTEVGGKGKWGGPYSFISTSATSDDQMVNSATHLEEVNTNSVYVYTLGGNHTFKPAPAKFGLGESEPYLFVHHAMGERSWTAFEWTDTPTDQVDIWSMTGGNGTNEINRVLLGGRGTKGGVMQWNSLGNGANRTWNGRVGEMLVFTDPLSVGEETQLLAYLRAKWLGKGDASAEPPAFLSGRYAAPAFDGVGLDLADGVMVEQAGPTCALASLTAGDDVTFTRDWSGDAAGFALFNVAGEMTFGMNPTLNLVAAPAETVKAFGGVAESADWLVTGEKANRCRVVNRADGIYLSVGTGTVLILR